MRIELDLLSQIIVRAREKIPGTELGIKRKKKEEKTASRRTVGLSTQ